MSELVLLHHNEPMTTSETIAEGVELAHKTVIQLVRKYISDLSEWGEVAFQMRLNPQGSSTEVAWLNEGQSMFLMTLMRNSPVVLAFKKALVKAFLELRDRVSSPSPAFETRNLSHGADLAVAADRTFRGFLRSARSAGLRLPQALHVANRQTIARTGMDMLAELGVVPEDEPAPPVAVDLFAIGPFLRDWLEGRLPLPATICASTDLYSAYLHWRKKVSPGETAAINLFGGVLRRAYPAVRKTKLRFRVGGNTGLANAVVVQGAYDAVPPESRSTYAGIEIGRFAQALKDWPAQ